MWTAVAALRAPGPAAPSDTTPVAIDQGKEIAAKDVKRIVAFVIDDLTIPVTDLNCG